MPPPGAGQEESAPEGPHGDNPPDPLHPARRAALKRLVLTRHRLADLSFSDRTELRQCYLAVCQSFQQLDDQVQLRFLEQQQYYEALAAELA
ncbi:hypothetical protein E1298_25695 [Actinomadura rubrisoli]|uniref:Uncharacterized protein n=1 Tax=Actinomadura rubrisoli TaxID=2530368 RepID=A0A4R5B624_9ACTN|nr:hypothetical protein E1298_25695 [Actinomadura rubrisoli]